MITSSFIPLNKYFSLMHLCIDFPPPAPIFDFKNCSNSFFSAPPSPCFCKVKSLQQCIFVLTFVSSVLSNMCFKVQAWGLWFTSCWKHSSWDLHITPKRLSYIPSYHLHCWISLNENLNTQFQICTFFAVFLKYKFSCWARKHQHIMVSINTDKARVSLILNTKMCN